jgi:hypothetical protein
MVAAKRLLHHYASLPTTALMITILGLTCENTKLDRNGE